MQKDVVLRFEHLCTSNEILSCDDKVSEWFVTKEVPGIDPETNQPKTFVVKTDTPLCSLAVPASCPRIRCYSERLKDYHSCRMSGLVQSQRNESGFWLKLPCSECTEKTNLSEMTRRFVYEE